MGTIDWNNPDICKKYQARNGQPILAVHCPPEWAQGMSRYPVVVRHANGVSNRHSLDGRIDCDPHPLDIVPIPREPRTVEGWMKAKSLSGDATNATVLFELGRRDPNWVRVRITEVIE